jgi:hypothetical protein
MISNSLVITAQILNTNKNSIMVNWYYKTVKSSAQVQPKPSKKEMQNAFVINRAIL